MTDYLQQCKIVTFSFSVTSFGFFLFFEPSLLSESESNTELSGDLWQRLFFFFFFFVCFLSSSSESEELLEESELDEEEDEYLTKHKTIKACEMRELVY